MEVIELKGYYSTRQVAEKLNVTKWMVVKYIKSKKLKAYRVDQYYVIDEKDLSRFIESRKNDNEIKEDKRYKVK